MGKTAVIVDVVVIAVVIAATLIAPVQPRSPAITIRHIKSVKSGDWVAATFEIKNHTARTYSVYPVSVEVSNGLVWKACADFSSQSFPIDDLGPHGSVSRTFYTTNLPTGSPLRLRLLGNEDLAGLDSFFMRLHSRFLEGHKNVSLNPFDKTRVFPETLDFVSDEFVEPEQKQTAKR